MEALKVSGNAAYARGDFASAIADYTSALSLADVGSQHLLLSNRAAAHLARGAPGDALAALGDSNAALRLAPTFAKAHGRKGAALQALGQTGEALQSYQSAVRHDPASAALRASLEATNERLLKERSAAAVAAPAAQPRPPLPAAAATEKRAAPEDDLSAFLGEVGGLSKAAEEKKQELERTHAPISLAKEAYSSAYLSSLPGGVKALMDGTDAPGGAAAGATTASEVLARWAALGAGTEEEAAERARLDAEAIARVSTGREYELEGEAAAAQSAAVLAADLGDGAAQVERLTGPHHAWLNLNPFGVLSLPHSVTEDDIKGRYRRISALVHPDKCDHPRASDAFQEVKKAYDALQDPNKRRIAAGLIHVTLRDIRKERRRAISKLEAAGLFAELARLPPLGEVEATEVRKAFAEVEHRKATYEARIKSIAAREAEEAAEEHERQVEAAKADVAWAEGREARVEQWRSFGASLGAGAGAKRPRCEEGEGEEGGGGGEGGGLGDGGGGGGGGGQQQQQQQAAAAAAAGVEGGAQAAKRPAPAASAVPAAVTGGGLRVNDTMKYGANAQGGGDWKKKWR